MGIEHRIKELETENTCRCPSCKHVSTVGVKDEHDSYFYCQNPKCEVERIYGDNKVMVPAKLEMRRDQ